MPESTLLNCAVIFHQVLSNIYKNEYCFIYGHRIKINSALGFAMSWFVTVLECQALDLKMLNHAVAFFFLRIKIF